MSALCQQRTHAPQQMVLLLDHLVGDSEQVKWDGKPERLRGREIDHKVELGGLLDWNIARLRPTQNPVCDLGGDLHLISAWAYSLE
jgi:hypothetical protein